MTSETKSDGVIIRNRVLGGIVLLIIRYLNKMLRFNALDSFCRKSYYERSIYRYSQQGAEIGEGSILYNVNLSFSSVGDTFVIGRNCCLTNCTLLGHDASPATFIEELVNDEKVYMPGSRRSFRNRIVIGDNVFIGYGAIVLPGVNIDSDVIVAAGAVVTKNVKSGDIVGGNPAKIIGTVDSYCKFHRENMINNPDSY